MGGLIFVIVIVALILWVLASCIRIVPQAYAIVVERLGAYKDAVYRQSSQKSESERAGG